MCMLPYNPPKKASPGMKDMPSRNTISPEPTLSEIRFFAALGITGGCCYLAMNLSF